MRAGEASRWLPSDRWSALGQAAVALGILALALAVAGVGRSDRLDEALSYVTSGGFGGLFLIVSGLLLRSSAQARDEWSENDDIRRALSRSAIDR